MQVSKNFVIQEFVPPQIYNLFADKTRCLWYVKPELIKGVQLLRDILDSPITVNNWHKGGPFSESGYRIPPTKTGSVYSQHKLRCAADPRSEKYTPKQMQEAMRAHFDEFKKLGIRTLESLAFTPTWVHMDCRPALDFYPEYDFYFVEPK